MFLFSFLKGYAATEATEKIIAKFVFALLMFDTS